MQPTRTVATDRIPSWFAEGLVTATSFEHLILKRRRGMRDIYEHDLPVDIETPYLEEHSRETVERLAELGVNFYLLHGFKGFGLAAEARDRALSAQATGYCHELGLKAGVHVSVNLIPETLALEEPDVFDWIAVDEYGDPVLCMDEFFYVPCYSNPGFRAYFKRVLTALVTEVRTDLIHLDWFPGAYAEATSCCCEHCTTGFRAHLADKYPDPSRLEERLGYATIAAVRPPRFDSRPIQKNPLVQEWTDFRCLLAADFLRDMNEHLYELNPEVAIDLNAFGLGGWNTQYRATDHPRLLPHSHGFWDESDHFAQWTEDGRLITKIRTYKVARLLRNGVFSYVAGGWRTAGTNEEIILAEALAFQGPHLGSVLGMEYDGPTIWPSAATYIGFRSQNLDLYRDTESLANVAVLRSFPSLAYQTVATELSVLLYEQALIEARVPFDIIFDQQLADLGKYEVLVLANAESLSDAQIRLIERFVADGGGLVITDGTGRFNEWRRVRPAPALGGLFPDGLLAEAMSRSTAIRTETSQGAGLVYIPRVIPVKEPPRELAESYPRNPSQDPVGSLERGARLDLTYWHPPRNAQELIDATHRASRRGPKLTVDASRGVTVELLGQKDAVLLHLVNYRGAPEFQIRVGLRLDQPVTSVRVMAPDHDPEDLPFHHSAGRIEFQLPRLDTYAVVRLTLNREPGIRD